MTLELLRLALVENERHIILARKNGRHAEYAALSSIANRICDLILELE